MIKIIIALALIGAGLILLIDKNKKK